jgi:diguanylate cyclase (GGDEF)-like protein
MRHMHIDTFTVLLFGLLLKLPLCILFLLFWFTGRRASGFLWWSLAMLFGGVAGGLFMIRGLAGEYFTIGIGVAALIAALDCCWQGARAFEGRRPLRLPMLLPAVWLVACMMPGFIGNTAYRVVLSSALVTPLIAMAAVEFWRGRSESLASRWPVIALFSSLSLFFAVRIPLVGVAPYPFGAMPEQSETTAIFSLIVIFHTLLLAVLLVAMSKERLELEQRTRAQTDPLTGALNRLAFMTRGMRIVQRHEGKREPLCILFIDLDHFKSLNDRHGHSGGDDVLAKFVAVVHENIRPTDFLFRIGGEEFCCLLPATRAEYAIIVAQRIRRQVEAATVDVAGTPVRVTVSIGIASAESFGYDVDTLLRRADMAVYEAKRQGRNRVVVAEPSDTSGVSEHITVAGGGGLVAAE